MFDRCHRVDVALKLPLRQKAKKRLAARPKQHLEVPGKLNHTWSIDFMQDYLENGPEFIARIMSDWSEGHGIDFSYIQPDKPTQNASIERFNGNFRKGVLDAFLFDSLDDLRDQAAIWIDDYNNHRPHYGCNNLPPVRYAQQYLPIEP